MDVHVCYVMDMFEELQNVPTGKCLTNISCQSLGPISQASLITILIQISDFTIEQINPLLNFSYYLRIF